MKLSEYRGDEALDILADIIEPVSEIFADKEVSELFKQKGVKLATVAKVIIKKHKKAVKTFLAVLERKDPETYEPTVFELPIKLIEILNDKELISVFQSQGLTGGANSSTSVLENITE